MEALLSLFEIHVPNPWMAGIIKVALISLVLFFLLGISSRLLRPAIYKLVSIFQSFPEEKIIAAFLTLIRKILILVAFSLSVSSLPLPEAIDNFINNAIFIVVAFFILLGLFDLSNIVGLFVRSKAAEFEILVNRVLKIIFATVVLMITMRHFNYDIWHIMTALGVGTLAVGLAAQPTLANMIAGFTILIDRPFRRGDRILLTGGETGDVVNIGMRSTHILNTDGNMLVVSNSELVNTKLINFSFPNNTMGSKVKIYIDHAANIGDVKSLLKVVTDRAVGVVEGTANPLLTAINEWGIEVTVFFNIENFAQSSKIIDAIMDSAILEFQKKGIKIATNPMAPIPRS